MKFYLFILCLFFFTTKTVAFSYDSKNLRGDLESASDIVIAKKVGGVLAYRYITDEIDSYQADPIDWRNSQAWERLQKRNNTESTFLVLNSIKGEFNIGDEFEFNDSYIPVELGSVMLFFLDRENNHIESNPCHRIDAEKFKTELIGLSKDSSAVIEFVLNNGLSFCDEL